MDRPGLDPGRFFVDERRNGRWRTAGVSRPLANCRSIDQFPQKDGNLLLWDMVPLKGGILDTALSTINPPLDLVETVSDPMKTEGRRTFSAQ